ncbi:hypothetical protein cypCar_00032381 [Cyprinus carpio]|nr:hypothetical protein cypCar_00032381 [Cyprinus carpio]
MADTDFKLERAVFVEVSDDDEEVALVLAATKPATTSKVFKSKRGDYDDDDDDDDSAEEVDLVLGPGLDGGGSGEAQKSEAQATGMKVLALLDKIIGVVDQIQQTQTGLEAKQETMEKNMSSIQTELAKLAKSHIGTAGTVNKLLDKVRKVNVNVKSVRTDLEKQVGQIKKLENNEHELLKRKNFKVLIFQVLKLLHSFISLAWGRAADEYGETLDTVVQSQTQQHTSEDVKNKAVLDTCIVVPPSPTQEDASSYFTVNSKD